MSKREHHATTRVVDAGFEIFFHDQRVAESEQAIELREYYRGRELAPVYYFAPELLADLDARESRHSTFCPIKGETRYWHFADRENAIWSYPDPLEGVAAIRGRVAFDSASGFRIERGNA
ncbi:MAG: DUF427 domain-containing protein [Gammaproteobacteria bacterium]|nr:DUF427 domain-containing protein [Gammaproteobacteria bacterium]